MRGRTPPVGGAAKRASRVDTSRSSSPAGATARTGSPHSGRASSLASPIPPKGSADRKKRYSIRAAAASAPNALGSAAAAASAMGDSAGSGEVAPAGAAGSTAMDAAPAAKAAVAAASEAATPSRTSTAQSAGTRTPAALDGALVSKRARRSGDEGSDLLRMLKSRTPLQRKVKYSVMDLGGARPSAVSSPVLQGARKRWSALSTKLGLAGGGGGGGSADGSSGSAAGGASSRARAHDPEEIDAFLAEEREANDAETQRVLRKAQLDWELQAQTTRAAVEKERNEQLAAMDRERNEWQEQLARERNEWKEKIAQLELGNSTRIHELRLLAESKLEQAGADVEDLEMRSESLERELQLSAEIHDHQYREVAIYHRTLVRLRAGFHFRR